MSSGCTHAPDLGVEWHDEDRASPEMPDQQDRAAQVRAFLELTDFLLGLDLPPETRRAWERFL